MTIKSIIPIRLRQMLQAHRELWFGEPEIALLEFLCDFNKVSLDIGANRGLYTHWLARCSASVIAFEPSAAHCARLRLVSPANVDIRQCVISDVSGNATLRVPMVAGKMEFGLATLAETNSLAGLDSRQVEVRKWALDDLGLSNVGLIKIDVEGHELAVIEGARDLLEREHPRLIIELEERHRPDAVNSATKLLASLGYCGFFLWQNRLCNIGSFIPTMMQDPQGLSSRYTNNFIFTLSGDIDWMAAAISARVA